MHEELDKKIIEAVKAGKTQFHRLSEFLAVPGRNGFRVVDRRLQALRKKGALKYDRKSGWSVAN